MKTMNARQILTQISNTAFRFPFVILSLFGLAVMMWSDINSWSFHNQTNLWILFWMAVPVTMATNLLTANKLHPVVSKNIVIVSFILLALYALFFVKGTLSDEQMLQHAIVGGMFLMFCFMAAFFTKGEDDNIWEFSRKSILNLVISGIFAGVLFAGLGLAYLAIQMLFQYKSDGKIYGDIAVLSLVVFGPVYFLSQVPPTAELHNLKPDFNKVVKFLGSYILFPLLNIYLIILYVYLGKILINWELPVGVVATPVSILGIASIVTFLVLKPVLNNSETNYSSKFFKFFPYLFLPLLGLMTVGIARRIGDYGITYSRLFVIVLNVWFYGISLYMILSKSIKIKTIFLSFIVLGLLSCIGPWNVFRMDKMFRVEKPVEKTIVQPKPVMDKK